MKNSILFLALFLALFAFFSCSSQSNAKNVDSENFKNLISQNTGVLIDLRTNEEIERKGMIEGAIQIDYFSKNAEAEIAKLDLKKTYLIYCAGGGRSGECAELMTKLGFKYVINLEKGFDDWKRKGLPIQTPQKKEN
jgi:phage shock protein E